MSKQREKINLEGDKRFVRMGDANVDPEMFERFPTGKEIDYIISDEGGVMRGTVVMVIGDPGVGKTTITNDTLADIQKKYPDLDILFISSEEGYIDRAYNQQKSPKTGQTLTMFLGEMKDKKKTLEEIFDQGWDIILLDSFKDTQDKIQAESNEMNINEAEAWLLNLMVKAASGDNIRKTYTLFICIQQVTKGKEFVGSNALKHNTTAMMEMRFCKDFPGQRYVVFTKNRRCGAKVGEKLYYKFDEATKELKYSKEPEPQVVNINRHNLTFEEILPKRQYSIEELMKYVPSHLSVKAKKKEIDKIRDRIEKGLPIKLSQ